MEHRELHQVTGFSIVGPYELDVTFEDGLIRRINFSDILEGLYLGPLKDLSLFNAVRVESHTLVWPNDADFDPSELHDWPEVKDAWEARARELRRGSKSSAR